MSDPASTEAGRGEPAVLRDPSAVDAFMASVAGAPFLAMDTETSGLDPHVDKLLLVQVGTAERRALVDAQALPPEVLERLFPQDQPIVFHNASFDLKMLAARGLSRRTLAAAQIMDTMICEQLLRSGRQSELANGRMGLSVLAERYANMSLDKSVRAGFFNVQSAGDLGDAELRYAERDVEATWRVFAAQLPLLRENGLLKVAAIEGAACFAFAEMERAGFPIDAPRWAGLVAGAGESKRRKRQALDEAFASVAERNLFGDTDLNYDDDAKVLDALHRLGVEIDAIKNGALEAAGHPAALALLEYREHQKIVSTYGEAFLEHVHKVTGRMHSRFKPVGASTGRASSSDPNLQNIPKGSEFRTCFRAPEGRKLVTADYSGAELRILAEASGDPLFVASFLRGEDLHSKVATEMFERPVSKTENPLLRDRAKAINFGLVYGMGAGGLAAQLDCGLEEASRLLDRYFQRFPAVKAYLEQSARLAKSRGYAETLAGRRHWFKDLERRGLDDGAIERIAKNMPIQGTNADITKLAMARVVRALAERDLDAPLVNMIHDELVVECPAAAAEEVREILVREMRSAGAELVTRVPVEVEAAIGDTWQH